MCNLCGYKAIKLQKVASEYVIYKNTDGMYQKFAVHPAGQMPQISISHFFDVKLFAELSNYCSHFPSYRRNGLDIRRGSVIMHVRANRCFQINVVGKQFPVQITTDIAFVTDDQSVDTWQQFPQGIPFIGIGVCQGESRNDTGKTDQEMASESIELLRSWGQSCGP